MSKERCDAVKAQLKGALAILNAGTCGTGKGVSQCVTFIEQGFMWLDYHMRQNQWMGVSQAPATQPTATVVGNAVMPPGSIMPRLDPTPPQKPVQTLVPSTTISTGLNPGKSIQRPPEEVAKDLSLLEDVTLL